MSRSKRIAVFTAAVCLAGAAACREATSPNIVPLTFELASNCAPFDAERSWTFFVDDSLAASATIGSGASVTVQIGLGNHKASWRWNRAVAPVTSRYPAYFSANPGSVNKLKINCQ
jgi:hypothetical protein